MGFNATFLGTTMIRAVVFFLGLGALLWGAFRLVGAPPRAAAMALALTIGSLLAWVAKLRSQGNDVFDDLLDRIFWFWDDGEEGEGPAPLSSNPPRGRSRPRSGFERFSEKKSFVGSGFDPETGSAREQGSDFQPHSQDFRRNSADARAKAGAGAGRDESEAELARFQEAFFEEAAKRRSEWGARGAGFSTAPGRDRESFGAPLGEDPAEGAEERGAAAPFVAYQRGRDLVAQLTALPAKTREATFRVFCNGSPAKAAVAQFADDWGLFRHAARFGRRAPRSLLVSLPLAAIELPKGSALRLTVAAECLGEGGAAVASFANDCLAVAPLRGFNPAAWLDPYLRLMIALGSSGGRFDLERARPIYGYFRRIGALGENEIAWVNAAMRECLSFPPKPSETAAKAQAIWPGSAVLIDFVAYCRAALLEPENPSRAAPSQNARADDSANRIAAALASALGLDPEQTQAALGLAMRMEPGLAPRPALFDFGPPRVQATAPREMGKRAASREWFEEKFQASQSRTPSRAPGAAGFSAHSFFADEASGEDESPGSTGPRQTNPPTIEKGRMWALGVLELGPSAGPEDMRAAYRSLMRICHPDRHARESEERRRFANKMAQELNEAKQTLGF